MSAARLRGLPALLFALMAGSALAQAWPAKPIRWIVPFPPGGATDLASRPVAERLTQVLGQVVVVENRVGAGGNIGAEAVARSPADGYTVLATVDSIAAAPHLHPRLGFDPLKDFVPVTQLSRQPLVLAVHPLLRVDSVAELVATAKAKPGLAVCDLRRGNSAAYRCGVVREPGRNQAHARAVQGRRADDHRLHRRAGAGRGPRPSPTASALQVRQDQVARADDLARARRHFPRRRPSRRRASAGSSSSSGWARRCWHTQGDRRAPQRRDGQGALRIPGSANATHRLQSNPSATRRTSLRPSSAATTRPTAGSYAS